MILTYITFLLQQRHQVVIPGWGGVCVHQQAAYWDELTGYYMPPAKQMVWQELAQVSYPQDDLLIKMCMHDQQVTYEQAQIQIVDFVKQMQDRLNHYGEVAFGRCGVLRREADGELVFKSLLYDYAPVKITPLRKRRGQALLRFTWYQWASVLVIILAASFGVLYQGDIKQQLMSFLKFDAGPVQVELAQENQPETQLYEILTQPFPTPVYKHKLYYIIVGSFATENQARAQIIRLQKYGEDISYVKMDDRYRLYAEVFEDEQAARLYLKRLRSSDPIFKDAWVISKSQ